MSLLEKASLKKQKTGRGAASVMDQNFDDNFSENSSRMSASPTNKFSLSKRHKEKKQKNSFLRAQTPRASNSMFSQDNSIGSTQERSSSQIFRIMLNNDELLPEVYNKNQLKRKYNPQCFVCDKKFDKLGNHQFHCKRCGNSVCGSCSDQRIPLSKRDKKELHRVCDQCYCELQHFKLKKDFQDVKEVLESKMAVMETEQVNIEDNIKKGKGEIIKVQDSVEKGLHKLREKVNKQKVYQNEISSQLETLISQRNQLYAQLQEDEQIHSQRTSALKELNDRKGFLTQQKTDCDNSEQKKLLELNKLKAKLAQLQRDKGLNGEGEGNMKLGKVK